MTASLGRAKPVADRFGTYDFGGVTAAAVDDDPRLGRTAFGRQFLRLLLASFVASAGRQYAQLCDMYVLTALIQRRHQAGQVSPDWELLLVNRHPAQFAAWPLPGGHTTAPARVTGQVAGVYCFWWTAFCDVFRHRYLGFPPPPDIALLRRLETFGVAPYATSSSSGEELAAIRLAFAGYRDDRAALDPPELLVRRCVEPHLGRELHWQVNPRPRSRSHPGEPRPDRHELALRTHIQAATATPVPDRSPYDELFVLLADEVRSVAAGAAGPRLRRLHERVVAAYNANHPDDAPIAGLVG